MSKFSLGISKLYISLNIFYWLLFTSLGIFIPTLLGFTILRYFGLFENWNVFFLNGEFAVYSNSLYMYTLYIAGKDFPKYTFYIRPFFIISSITGLIFSTGIFCAVIFSAIIKQNRIFLISDNNFLMKLTIFLFVSSVIVSLIANLVENIRVKIDTDDIKKAKTEYYLNFKNKFKQRQSNG